MVMIFKIKNDSSTINEAISLDLLKEEYVVNLF